MNEDLNKMIYLNKSILRDKQKLKAINVTMYDLKSKENNLTGVYSGVKDVFFSVDKDIDTKAIIKARIENNNQALDILKKDLIKKLDNVDDDLMVDIMFLRYIDFFSWSKICKILNYSRSRIFQKHNQCINLISNINNNKNKD